MSYYRKMSLLLLLLLLTNTCFGYSTTPYPTVVFAFSEKGPQLAGLGEKISTLIFSQLSDKPDITLVDRKELDKLQDEAMLNLSGMVNPQQANQIGQLTGAKIIVTGTLFEIENKLMIVSKIIGTETSRVYGASVSGNAEDSFITLSELLSEKIADIIANKGEQLVAKPVTRDQQLTMLKKQLQTSEKPSVTIKITEHHINRRTSDPAAEIEMTYFSTESGFEVIDKNSGQQGRANVLIVGEGFSEFATRKGNMVGVKARLEIKAIDQATGKILAVDRQTEMEIDLSEIIASKKALQRASAKIATRILPKLIK